MHSQATSATVVVTRTFFVSAHSITGTQGVSEDWALEQSHGKSPLARKGIKPDNNGSQSYQQSAQFSLHYCIAKCQASKMVSGLVLGAEEILD